MGDDLAKRLRKRRQYETRAHPSEIAPLRNPAGPRAVARIKALKAEVKELRETVAPFAEYAAWALRHEIPPAIAECDMTPVWGQEDATGETETRCIRIGDLKRVAALAAAAEKGETTASGEA